MSESNRTTDFIKSYVRLKPIAIDQLSLINFTRKEVKVMKYNYEPFQYDQVFGDSCKNNYIFQTVMLPIVSHIFEGYNACILAYGQTFSGKTYTMKGEQNNLGLIPLTIRQIFNKIKADSLIAKVSISYFQVYNENIYDLLSKEPYHPLQLRDDGKKNAIIQNLTDFQVFTQGDSLALYDQGERIRKFASNNINLESSRSHTIFKINLQVAHADLTTSVSTINMVDLAGSQDIGRTNAKGLLKKENENINKSLLALSNVIRSLSEKNSYINFRDSKLTRILQSSLSDKSKTAVICTINQTAQCIGETINTLKFGVSANSIKISAQKNIINNAPTFDNDPKYEQLCNILEQQRAEKQALKHEILKLHSQIASYKQFEASTLNEMNSLKHKLLMEQRENVNNSIILQNLKGQRQQQEQRADQSIGNFQDSIKLYKSEIARWEITVAEIKQSNQNYRRLCGQLERNERTLLDKLAKYQRELSALQDNLNNQQKQIEQAKLNQSMMSKSKKAITGQGRQPQQRSKQLINRDSTNSRQTQIMDNPYTISKIIQLSTRILDMKIQLNEYIKANTELQEQNQKLTAKIELMEKNPVPITIEQDNFSQKSKTSRMSGATKYNEWEIRSIKQENKKLKIEKISLLKKMNQLRNTLKKSASNHIEELQGFNKFIEKNFSEKEKEYFQFMFDENPQDYETIQPSEKE